MRPNPHFDLTDQSVIRRLIEENPWATIVSNTSHGLVASHYSILIDDSREELSIVTHLGRPDERVHELGSHQILVIVQGPHGYISPSWYDQQSVIPTWNFAVAHLSGTPEVLSENENFKVLERLVSHFEAPMTDPRLLNNTTETFATAKHIARGTVGLRLTPTDITAKRKRSQNKPQFVPRILAELEGDGPYASHELAQEMRLAHEV